MFFSRPRRLTSSPESDAVCVQFLGACRPLCEVESGRRRENRTLATADMSRVEHHACLRWQAA